MAFQPFITLKNLVSPGQDVDDARARWMGCRPEFEVLDPIVDGIPVDMVNVLGRQKWPTEVRSHDQPMHGDRPDARRVRMALSVDVLVSAVPPGASSAPRTHGDIGLNVAVDAETSGMRLTQPMSVRSSIAANDGALGARCVARRAQWWSPDLISSVPPLVVHVAPASTEHGTVAMRNGARVLHHTRQSSRVLTIG